MIDKRCYKGKNEFMLNKYAPYILAFSLLIFGLSLGFLIGKNPPKNITVQNDSRPAVTAEGNNLYSAQTASLMGTILSRDGDKMTVKNLYTGAQGEIKTSPRLTITKSATKNASPSSDLSSIELNKDVLINLEMVDGEYQAVSIQYPLPAPSLPPIPSRKPSSQPSPAT